MSGLLKYLQDRAKICSKVHTLDFSSGASLPGFKLSSLLSNCPLLEKFLLHEVSHTNILTRDAIKAFAMYSKRLRHFVLSSNREINSTNLYILLQGCLELCELHLYFCPFIDDACLQQIGKYCEKLHAFSSRPYDVITDMGILAIAHSCPNLISLNLYACLHVSNEAIREVCRSCPHLQELMLGAMSISDDNLHDIAEFCPDIRKLVFASCFFITAEGVMEVVHACKLLYLLEIRNCYQLPQDLASQIEDLEGRTVKCIQIS